MKEGTKLTVLIIGMIIGFGLMIWGSIIMRHYDGYLEIIREARRAAAPQLIIGWVIMIVSYILLYRIDKK